MVEGYREPGGAPLADVELTGDEFLHVVALFSEAAGGPLIHDRTDIRGFPSPECECCQSIMRKYEAHHAGASSLLD